MSICIIWIYELYFVPQNCWKFLNHFRNSFPLSARAAQRISNPSSLLHPSSPSFLTIYILHPIFYCHILWQGHIEHCRFCTKVNCQECRTEALHSSCIKDSPEHDHREHSRRQSVELHVIRFRWRNPSGCTEDLWSLQWKGHLREQWRKGCRNHHGKGTDLRSIRHRHDHHPGKHRSRNRYGWDCFPWQFRGQLYRYPQGAHRQRGTLQRPVHPGNDHRLQLRSRHHPRDHWNLGGYRSRPCITRFSHFS